MPPEEKDPAFLWDMRELARKLAGELYRSCREHLVPLSILLKSMVTAPPPDDEDRAL